MTTKDIFSIYDKINEQLYSDNVAEAFFLIRKMVKEVNDWNLSVLMDEYSSTYQHILAHSLISGKYPSEGNDTIYKQLILNLYLLTQKAKEAFMTKNSNLLEYEGQRFLANNPNVFFNDVVTGFDQIHQALRQHYNSLKQVDSEGEDNNNISYWHTAIADYQKRMSPLFAYTFLKNDMSDIDLDHVKAIISDSEVGIDAKCIIISALTMNTLRNFDAKKTNVLLSLAEHNDNTLRQRALVGLVLIISKYGHIVEYDEHLKNRIAFLCKNRELVAELLSIVFQIVRSTETNKISKQINEDIMPELIKISPIIQDKLDDIDFDDDSEKIKPKIENMFDEIGFSDKIQDFTELQMSGSDVFASTFAQMKGFPFFSFIENWLLPFDRQNPYVRRLFNKKEKLGDTIIANPLLCNSDKFSFSLNLLQMPDNQLNTVEFAIKEEKEQIDEMIKDMDKSQNYSESKVTANHYILDLYRFYSYFPRHNDLENPLVKILNLGDSKMFDILFVQTDDKQKVADFYYQYNHYNQAIGIYSKIIDPNEADLDIYRNLAYSFQQTGDYRKAIDYYIIAESLDKNNTWYLRRLAFCYRQIGDLAKTIDCYNAILDSAKDDFRIMSKLAICHIECCQYDEALSLLYKIDYLKPNYPKIKSVLMLCLFYSGKLEQANELVTKELPNFTDMKDFITAGHISLAIRAQHTAIEHYKQAISKAKDLKSFLAAFYADANLLRQHGVSSNELNLVTEVVLIDKFR
ncbi:MAG: hypothetical protein Q4A56_08330 [Porphyromonadaceae bacterium]|nr:hypothetical protein [Porphyromonadaceae bacterium]